MCWWMIMEMYLLLTSEWLGLLETDNLLIHFVELHNISLLKYSLEKDMVKKLIGGRSVF